jgi:hypothetical protein
MTSSTTTIADVLTLIAQKHLFMDTLETRHSDRLDFYDVSVCGVKAALEEAFKAGVAVGAAVGRVPTTTHD